MGQMKNRKEKIEEVWHFLSVGTENNAAFGFMHNLLSVIMSDIISRRP